MRRHSKSVSDRKAITQASSAAMVLEEAWAMLRLVDSRIPREVVLLVLTIGDRRRKYGHFAGSSWRYVESRRLHEVAVSPYLFSTPAELLATILHEAAHAILFPRANGGCSPNGYYHRRDFRDLCIELGLRCTFRNNRYGWCVTSWPDGEVPSRYEATLKLLRKRMPAGTDDPPFRRKLPPPPRIRLVCRCPETSGSAPPRAIYASRSVEAAGGVLCTRCGAEFQRATLPRSVHVDPPDVQSGRR